MNMVHGALLVDAGEGRRLLTARASRPRSPTASRRRRSGSGSPRGRDDREAELHLRPGGVSCASCVATIESALLALPGVDRAAVNMGTERVTVDYDPAQLAVEDLAARSHGLGLPAARGRSRHAHAGEDAEAEAPRAEIADLPTGARRRPAHRAGPARGHGEATSSTPGVCPSS